MNPLVIVNLNKKMPGIFWEIPSQLSLPRGTTQREVFVV